MRQTGGCTSTTSIDLFLCTEPTQFFLGARSRCRSASFRSHNLLPPVPLAGIHPSIHAWIPHFHVTAERVLINHTNRICCSMQHDTTSCTTFVLVKEYTVCARTPYGYADKQTLWQRRREKTKTKTKTEMCPSVSDVIWHTRHATTKEINSSL